MLASPRPLPASPPLAAKIALTIVLASACAFAVATFVHRTVGEINDASVAADHTYDLITRVERLHVQLLNLETGQRGYLLTGDKAYLAPYEQAHAGLDTQISALRALAAPSPETAEAVARLEPLIAAKVAELEKTIAARSRGLDAALAIVRTGEGARLMTDIRQILADITQQQWELLEVRQARKQEVLTRNAMAVAAVIGITALTIAAIVYLIYQDLARRRRYRRTVANLAFHDALTGLPNRAALTDRLAEAIANGAQYGHEVALLLADLDNFKRVNDMHGRAAGDRALKTVAGRLARIVHGNNLLARFPDDRFAILLDEITGPQEVALLARKMLAAVSTPTKLGSGDPVVLTASVGIGVAPHDGDDAETLLASVEAAMFSAKAAGKNTYRYHRDAAGVGISG